VPPVLLPDDHDQRRPVHARGCEGTHRVPEPGGRVQEAERGLAAPDRVPGREPDDGALVLVDAKSPVSFFAYPGKPGNLLPEGCEVIELAGRRGDEA